MINDILTNMDDYPTLVALSMAGVIFVIIVSFLIFVIIKINHNKNNQSQDNKIFGTNEYLLEEYEFDESTNNSHIENSTNNEDGETLDNGDYVGKSRVAQNNNFDENFGDSISVINDDVEVLETTQEMSSDTIDDLVSEHIIGDLNIDECSEEIQQKKPQQEFDLSVENDIVPTDDILEDYNINQFDNDDNIDSNPNYKNAFGKSTQSSTKYNEIPKSKYQVIVALSVMAKEDDYFEGADLLRHFVLHDLTYATTDGFYFKAVPGLPDKKLFNIAQVMKPGNFDPKIMNTLKTKGLLLFMNLPNKMDPVQAFKQMHNVAIELANDLGGTVCDSQLNELSDYRLEQMQDDMIELSLKLKVEYKRHTNLTK